MILEKCEKHVPHNTRVILRSILPFARVTGQRNLTFAWVTGQHIVPFAGVTGQRILPFAGITGQRSRTRASQVLGCKIGGKGIAGDR